MKVQDCCNAMLAEVTAWNEKLEAMKNELDDLFGTKSSSVDYAWRDPSPSEVGGQQLSEGEAVASPIG